MKLLESESNTNISIIDSNNKTVLLTCNTCKNDKFHVYKYLKNCETGFKILETACTYCGKVESYSYKECVFIVGFGYKI